MFPSFGQATQSSSPAVNPFASSAAVQANPFTVDGSGESTPFQAKKKDSGASSGGGKKRNPFNPFQDASTSDDGSNTGVADGQKRKAAGSTNRSNGNNPFGQNKGPPKFGAGLKPSAFGTLAQSQPTASFGSASTDKSSPKPTRSNDPHAKKVFEQLRKDDIRPPSWPSEPGNPKHKAEMARFREQYEAYRTKVRASLTRAGLIDDPDKRKTLQDAISFKGICEDMCPQFEMITRITEFDVHQPEKDPKTSFARPQRMVKKLARSAAGQEAPLPMDVRSVPALRRTLDYLIDDLLNNDANLPVLHGFLWDRTRAIRRDFAFFSTLTPEELKTQVYVLENIARFHVTALHLLSKPGCAPEDFVEQQELEQLGKALLSLRDLYDDCHAQGITCPNEAEFRAFYLLFHASDPSIMETLQRQWRPSLWKDSDEVRTAVSLVEAMQSTQDFHGPLTNAPSLAAASSFNSYFRILRSPKVSYTMACFAECHFPHLRRSILGTVKKALGRPKETAKDVTASVLNKFLQFDTTEQAIDFAELHGLEFGTNLGDPNPGNKYLILNNKQPLPHHRLQHQFSQKLVEDKRGARSLPDVLHQTVFKDTRGHANREQPSTEGSLFVPQDTEPSSSIADGSTALAGQGTEDGKSSAVNQKSPFSQLGAGVSTATAEQGNSTPNPFAPKTKSPDAAGTKPPANSPFSSTAAPPSFLSSVPGLPQTGQKQPFEAQKTHSQGEAKPGFFSLPKETASSTGNGPSSIGGSSASPFAIKPPATIEGSPGSKGDISQAPGPPSFQFSASTTTAASPAPATNTPTAAPNLPSTSGTASFLQSSPLSSTQSQTMQSKSTPGGIKQPQGSIGSSMSPSTQTASSPHGNPQMPAQGLSGMGSGPAITKESSPFTPAASTPPSVPPAQGQNLGSAPTLSSPGFKPLSQAPPRPRDLMGEFTDWFVNGDDGLLEEFKVFTVETMLKKVFDKYTREERERQQKEEKEEANAKADHHRTYSLSVKYFYRWKENARQRRLRQIRRRAKEQAREFHQKQKLAELAARKPSASRSVKEHGQQPKHTRPEELLDIVRQKGSNKREAEQALLASGVLSGVDNEREAISRIVRRQYSPSVDGSVDDNESMRSRSGSVSRMGGKSRALREAFLGSGSARFRRSLPDASSRTSTEPDRMSGISNVSERWRLKAMGIVQMRDGTAVPESLANEMQYGSRHYRSSSAIGMGHHGPTSRPVSSAGEGLTESRLARWQDIPKFSDAENGRGGNKRKRMSDDGGDTAMPDLDDNSSHKRIMSGADKVMSELKALREEMEEGASWFKSQNERMQSEIMSRETTPWDGSIL